MADVRGGGKKTRKPLDAKEIRKNDQVETSRARILADKTRKVGVTYRVEWELAIDPNDPDRPYRERKERELQERDAPNSADLNMPQQKLTHPATYRQVIRGPNGKEYTGKTLDLNGNGVATMSPPGQAGMRLLGIPLISDEPSDDPILHPEHRHHVDRAKLLKKAVIPLIIGTALLGPFGLAAVPLIAFMPAVLTVDISSIVKNHTDVMDEFRKEGANSTHINWKNPPGVDGETLRDILRHAEKTYMAVSIGPVVKEYINALPASKAKDFYDALDKLAANKERTDAWVGLNSEALLQELITQVGDLKFKSVDGTEKQRHLVSQADLDKKRDVIQKDMTGFYPDQAAKDAAIARKHDSMMQDAAEAMLKDPADPTKPVPDKLDVMMQELKDMEARATKLELAVGQVEIVQKGFQTLINDPALMAEQPPMKALQGRLDRASDWIEKHIFHNERVLRLQNPEEAVKELEKRYNAMEKPMKDLLDVSDKERKDLEVRLQVWNNDILVDKRNLDNKIKALETSKATARPDQLDQIEKQIEEKQGKVSKLDEMQKKVKTLQTDLATDKASSQQARDLLEKKDVKLTDQIKVAKDREERLAQDRAAAKKHN